MNKEYLINKSSEITLNITNGKVDSFREIDETQNTVRVYENGKIGVAGALGECDFKELSEKAVKALDSGIPYVNNFQKGIVKNVISETPAINKDKIMASTKRIAKKVANACPRFLVNGKTQFTSVHHSYTNSVGSDLNHKNSQFTVFFQFKDKDSSNIADAYFGATSSRYGKVKEDKIVNDVKMLHDNFFTEKVVLPDGEYPIVFGVYDIFGHLYKDIIAEYYVSGGSLFSGKLGEKLFNEKLNVYVDRNQKTNPLASFFDGEGQIAKDYRAPIIENGVLKNVLTTKNTSAMFNLPISKTSSSAYDGVPTIGLPGLHVAPTADNLKELLGNEKGIYVAITSGGDITTEGVVGLPCMLAFLIENGELKGRVQDFNANGNIYDMLNKNFVGVCKNDVFSSTEDYPFVVRMNIITDKK